jgi:hypothetical protein
MDDVSAERNNTPREDGRYAYQAAGHIRRLLGPDEEAKMRNAQKTVMSAQNEGSQRVDNPHLI